jgi:hypothetical protein
MLDFRVKQVANGYKVRVFQAGTGKQAIATDQNEYVFKSTEHVLLVEFLGQLICEYKVKVERK